MRGHDTYFPNCWEICIMSPYSAACLERFVDAAFGGIFGMGGAWLLERSVHINDVKNFLFKAVIRKRLCRVESGRARFAHDHVFPYPERRPLDAVEDGAEKMAAGDLCILSPD